MTTLINDPSVPFTRPNIFDDPVPWNQVRIAGILVSALAVAFDGIKIEHQWKKQKSKDSSGAVFSFNGSDPVGGESGFSITFRCVNRDDFAQMYDLYEALKPVPVHGGGSSGSKVDQKALDDLLAIAKTPVPIGSPPFDAEKSLASMQAALASLNSPSPAASSVDAAADQTAATTPQPSPGPRPPTVPIELGWLAFLGVFAVALKSWSWSRIEQDVIEVTIAFVQDKPPTPAGTGAMGAPKATTAASATAASADAAAKAASGV